MTTANILGNLFPEPGSIPEKYRLDGPTEQREYLVDGVLRTWPGPRPGPQPGVYQWPEWR
jgi:glyceraldehyde-3-phosphate dehydrogenase (NADP+)